MCKECAQERELHIKLEEERDIENFIDYVNLIRSGPGVFCRWGSEKRFPLIQTIDCFAVIFYDILFYLGVVFPLGHECTLPRLLCVSWRRNETCHDNFRYRSKALLSGNLWRPDCLRG